MTPRSRINTTGLGVTGLLVALSLMHGSLTAQTKAPAEAKAKATTKAPAKSAAAPPATLSQLMKGIFYPQLERDLRGGRQESRRRCAPPPRMRPTAVNPWRARTGNGRP